MDQVWNFRSTSFARLTIRQGGKCRQLVPSLKTGVPTCPTRTKSYRIPPKQLTITFHSQPNVSFSQSLEILWDDGRNAGTKASIAIRLLDLVFLGLLPSYAKIVSKQIFRLGQEWEVIWGLQVSFTKLLHIGTEAPKKFTRNTINLFEVNETHCRGLKKSSHSRERTVNTILHYIWWGIKEAKILDIPTKDYCYK